MVSSTCRVEVYFLFICSRNMPTLELIRQYSWVVFHLVLPATPGDIWVKLLGGLYPV